MHVNFGSSVLHMEGAVVGDPLGCLETLFALCPDIHLISSIRNGFQAFHRRHSIRCPYYSNEQHRTLQHHHEI